MFANKYIWQFVYVSFRVLQAQPASMTLMLVGASTAKMAVHAFLVTKAPNVCAPLPSLVLSASIPLRVTAPPIRATTEAHASISQRPHTTTASVLLASMASSATSWTTASQAALVETSHRLQK